MRKVFADEVSVTERADTTESDSVGPLTKSDSEGPLDSLRRELDAVNLEILDALIRRFQIVLRVQTCKQKHGLSLYDQQRVQQMLEGLRGQWALAKGGVQPSDAQSSETQTGYAQTGEEWRLIEGVFQAVFSASLELQAIAVARANER